MVTVEDLLQMYKNEEIDNYRLLEQLKYSYKQISEEIINQGRWTTLYRYVIQDDSNKNDNGKFYSFEQEYGSTECQDNEPFDPSTLQEVKPVQKTIIVYEPIKE